MSEPHVNRHAPHSIKRREISHAPFSTSCWLGITRYAASSMLAIMVAFAPAAAQDVVMRRPLPFRQQGPGQPGTPTPTPTPVTPGGSTGYHGWQPGCATGTPTAACVSIGTASDTVVDVSQCPATQDAAGEALAHEHGLFGMLDGVNAANRASVCGTGPDVPKSFYVAGKSCQGGYTQIECTQAFVNASGEMTARQIAGAAKCASQQDTPEFQAFVTGQSGVALVGSTYVAPNKVWSYWGAACSATPSSTKRVTAGQCSGDGGYVCTAFDVAKDAAGKYSVAKATPVDASQCYGNSNPSGAETDFIGSLGYYTPSGYNTPAGWCANYDTFGATSACKTTVKKNLGGGYDIDTGLDLKCYGLAPSPWNPSYIVANPVSTSRCASAGQPTPAQIDTITAANLLTYDQARSKDCGLAANIDYNYQWKVLSGNWNVRRDTATYEYPTAAMRAARTPREGDQYGEYTDWTYQGTFNLSAVCTDITPNDSNDSYWDGLYDSPIYQQNHTKPIESKAACAAMRDAMSSPYYYLEERVLPSVGETWVFEPRCYEPSYGMADKTQVTVGGNGATLAINRCSPARYRFFTFQDGTWQPGAYLEGNAQR